MVLRTKPEEDNWQNVTDAKKRKRIQDRLAQRARRRRLREARGEIASTGKTSGSTSSSSDSGASPRNHDQNATSLALTDLRTSELTEHPTRTRYLSWQLLNLIDQGTTDPAIVDLQASDMVERTPLTTSLSWQIMELTDQDDVPPLDSPSADTSLTDASLLPNNIHTLPSPAATTITLPLTVLTALFLNGQILNIPCSTIIAAKSTPATPEIPMPLRPTASQLTTVHFQWIDRLPFPKLRDSLIRLQGVVDLDDFLQDFFMKPSFRIKKGAQSWEPRAWSMEAGWAGKWGWLFF